MSEEESYSLAELLHSGYRYALSLASDQSRAEDVLQDAWLAVLKANGPHTRQYLFSAVRTRFLNVYKRELLLSIVPLDDVPEHELSIHELDMSDYLDHKLLEQALSGLRSIERESLFLMVVEGYTAQEIADLTLQSRNTVLSHVHRAKRKVRDFLMVNDLEMRHE